MHRIGLCMKLITRKKRRGFGTEDLHNRQPSDPTPQDAFHVLDESLGWPLFSCDPSNLSWLSETVAAVQHKPVVLLTRNLFAHRLDQEPAWANPGHCLVSVLLNPQKMQGEVSFLQVSDCRQWAAACLSN